MEIKRITTGRKCRKCWLPNRFKLSEAGDPQVYRKKRKLYFALPNAEYTVHILSHLFCASCF